LVDLEEGARLGWQRADRRMRPEVERLRGHVPPETEMAVLGIDREASPLAEEGEVRRLLALRDQEPRARADPPQVQRAEQRLDVLAADPREEALGLDLLAETDPHLALVPTRAQDEPRLGL